MLLSIQDSYLLFSSLLVVRISILSHCFSQHHRQQYILTLFIAPHLYFSISNIKERLLEMCAEQELVVGNSWFKKNDVYKYMWLRMAEGRVVDKALMDSVLLTVAWNTVRSESVERRRGGIV